MPEFLVFHLYGVMASWGDTAVGEYRPTHDHPTRSAVLGMVAAALGIRREEEKRLNELNNGYHVAVRLDRPGKLLRDYHTTQVPRSGSGKRKKDFATRKEELNAPEKDISTILSSRDYHCDAVYTICLWLKNNNPPHRLEELRDALNTPEFVLYLGRKSCPPALPLGARVVTGDNLGAIFMAEPFPGEGFLSRMAFREKIVRVYWEGDEDVGIQPDHSGLRHDDPLSRRRWQFRNRIEHYGLVQLIREEKPCT
ncbi:type I-E CRISPR-associated protein Cas5/CasD [Methanocalculus sp.]|uniref:type I-E CRISPR-associated protein Cas5/CasD n=1 Tax=Methanocalculus sp. TaxID=2004547 RepID=UPI0026121E81|nr:type I-E CRISPR-associated protein Cas5/CasD [Methanocalculus sp.]MDG6249204.1 type I-E CRISPR-associated protein Cas5/CasD [Methanocalculus sp.]